MTNRFAPRHMALWGVSLVLMTASWAEAAGGVHVTFDLPDTIECRDVTPQAFARVHPFLKVIEARFRISARLDSGSEAEIVDMLYMITSPNMSLKIQDYLPNTTLESAVVSDEIEVKTSAEGFGQTEGDLHVGYQAFGLGMTKTRSTKKTEANEYKQVAPKAMVLASGTTNREHGVFYKLKPSRAASLEGAKEFTFLAIVPRNWRGDWCTISCAAQAKKKSFLSVSVGDVAAGADQAQVGMYLASDAVARKYAEELRIVQQEYAPILANHMSNCSDGLCEAVYAEAATHSTAETVLCGIFFKMKSRTDPRKIEEAQRAIQTAQERLSALAE